MTPSVIALSSRIGAGKSTIARELSERLGWPRVSFGDYVRETARNQGMQETRANLQKLGESLVQQDPISFTKVVLSEVNFRQGAVIDGVRHLEILHTLQKLVAPLPVYLIYVEIDEKVRHQRLSQRGMTVDEIEAADSHSTEIQVGRALRENTALHAPGDGDTSKTVGLILEWLNNQQSR